MHSLKLIMCEYMVIMILKCRFDQLTQISSHNIEFCVIIKVSHIDGADNIDVQENVIKRIVNTKILVS